MIKMNDNMEMIDISDVKQDKFMKYIYISLVVLVVLGFMVYFFGYELLRPFIKV